MDRYSWWIYWSEHWRSNDAVFRKSRVNSRYSIVADRHLEWRTREEINNEWRFVPGGIDFGGSRRRCWNSWYFWTNFQKSSISFGALSKRKRAVTSYSRDVKRPEHHILDEECLSEVIASTEPIETRITGRFFHRRRRSDRRRSLMLPSLLFFFSFIVRVIFNRNICRPSRDTNRYLRRCRLCFFEWLILILSIRFFFPNFSKNVPFSSRLPSNLQWPVFSSINRCQRHSHLFPNSFLQHKNTHFGTKNCHYLCKISEERRSVDLAGFDRYYARTIEQDET